MGSEPPDWALKNVKGTKEQVGAILDDPMLLVEGMAQGISDTYESEGIWYCAGYAVGTYAGTKGIAEAGKAVRGKVEVKGKVGESGINSIIKNGKVSIDDLKANPSVFSGKSVDEIAQALTDAGYDVTVKASTRSRSGAQIIKINNPGGGKNISQVQV